nr:histidine kinase 1 [Tanacetum cinerariifolium]
MQFDVLAPWYKTGWAYLLYTLALGGSIILYRRFEMTQQELKNKLILEQFQTEKEKELTNLKLGFFTNVSHELRTPLTLILGPMEEIMRSPGPVANLASKVELMHRQARKLLELVNQLLDFRKVETGNVPLRATYTDAVAFLGRVELAATSIGNVSSPALYSDGQLVGNYFKITVSDTGVAHGSQPAGHGHHLRAAPALWPAAPAARRRASGGT